MRRHSSHLHRHPFAAAVAMVGPLLSACATAPQSDLVVHDSPRGTVVLERIADRSIQAAHPIRLEPVAIQAALRGLHIRAEHKAMDTLFASEEKVTRVFSEEDVQYLSPLVGEGLLTARADQLVRVTIVRPDPLTPTAQRTGAGAGSSESPFTSRDERTSATVYAYGLSLYLTVTEYRHRPERADTINMPNRRLPDPTGIGAREVLFLPASAVRPDSGKSGWLGDSGPKTLAIDYRQLAGVPPSADRTAPVPAPRPEAFSAEPSQRALQKAEDMGGQPPKGPSGAGTAATDEELQSVKDLVIKKDMELEALKKELRSLKKQMDDREPQPDTSKKKSGKPSPKPSATP